MAKVKFDFKTERKGGRITELGVIYLEMGNGEWGIGTR
jgi:hypothetical protein